MHRSIYAMLWCMMPSCEKKTIVWTSQTTIGQRNQRISHVNGPIWSYDCLFRRVTPSMTAPQRVQTCMAYAIQMMPLLNYWSVDFIYISRHCDKGNSAWYHTVHDKIRFLLLKGCKGGLELLSIPALMLNLSQPMNCKQTTYSALCWELYSFPFMCHAIEETYIRMCYMPVREHRSSIIQTNNVSISVLFFVTQIRQLLHTNGIDKSGYELKWSEPTNKQHNDDNNNKMHRDRFNDTHDRLLLMSRSKI